MPQTKHVLNSTTIHIDSLGRLHHDQDVPAEVITRAREWQPSTTYVVGDVILTPLESQNDHVMEFICDTGGVSGNSQPDWEVPGTTNFIEDGTCTWVFLRVPTQTYWKSGIIHRDSGPAMIYQVRDPLASSISNVLVNTFVKNGVITNGTSPSVWAYDLVTRQELPSYFQYTDEFGNRVDNTSGAIALNRVIGSLYTDGLSVPTIPVHPPADPLQDLSYTFRASAYDPEFVLNSSAEPASDGELVEYISNLSSFSGPGSMDATASEARAIYNFGSFGEISFPRTETEDPTYETFSNLTAPSSCSVFLVIRLPSEPTQIGYFDVYHGTGGSNPRLGTYISLNEFEGNVYLTLSSFIEEDAKGVGVSCQILSPEPNQILVIGLSPNLENPVDSVFTINGVRPGDAGFSSSIDTTDPVGNISAKVGIKPQSSSVKLCEMVLLETVLSEEDHMNCSTYFVSKWAQS